MTATTPVYGIPYPTATTKAKDLPAELAAMGAGVEAALVAASIPPVTPAAVMAAASAAARDAYWGVPTTEAERIALQNRGATTVRTDTGWEERYYATFNAATNPGGATPAGWYPVQGRLPTFRIEGTGNQPMEAGGWRLLRAVFSNTPLVNHGGFVFAGGALTVPVAGRYQIRGFFSVTRVELHSLQWTVNSAAADAGTVAKSEASGYSVTADAIIPLASGDVLRMFAVTPTAGTPAGLAMNVLEAAYLGPRQ